MVRYGPAVKVDDDALDASLFEAEPAAAQSELVGEIGAMETIAHAIEALTTDEARVRVLRGAVERFAPALLLTVSPGTPTPSALPDPTLSAEGALRSL